MKKYSLVEHVKRLKLLLAKDILNDNVCPATLDPDVSPSIVWGFDPHPCNICRDFVGVPKDLAMELDCPCYAFGTEEAIKRTRESIKLYEKKKGGRR